MTYDCGEDREIEFVKVLGNKVYTSRGIFERNNSVIRNSFYLGKDIAEDNNGNFIVGAYNLSGIIAKQIGESPNLPSFFNGRLKRTVFSPLEQVIFVLKTKRTRAVHFNQTTESYYSGNSDGLFVYSKNFHAYEIRDDQNNPIIAAQIQSDDVGTIWVATIQHGLYKIKNNRVIGSVDMSNGLPSNQCKKIRIEKNGIWLVTDGGLHLVDPISLRVKHISAYAGFDGLMINDIEIIKDKIYLSTNEGILCTHIEKISNEFNPKLTISHVESIGKKIQTGASLSYKQNSVLFKFRTTLFRSMGNFSYQYRLLGLNNDWILQDGKIQEVNFIALEPGAYVFEARVKLGDVFSKIERFSFVIARPFWRSFWFIGLIIILVFWIFYSIYLYQIRKLKTKQVIREQLALSQITALRTQMNPHFMFNILNAFQGLIYTNQKTKANEYLGVFSDLMRKTLDMSDQREVTIEEELSAIELYIQLEQARFDAGDFEYTLVTNNRDELKDFLIPSLILQPFIENAIKHGLLHQVGVKKLRLCIFRENDTYWHFEIEDNGIGREKSAERNKKFQKHKSFATKSIDTRIQLINKLSKKAIILDVVDLKNKDNNACGTRIVLKIPIKIK